MVSNGIVRAGKGTGRTIVIAIPNSIVEVEGIKVGDMLRIGVENTHLNKEVARRVKASKLASMTPSEAALNLVQESE